MRADIESLIAGLREKPADDTLRQILADAFEDSEPTPVERGYVPNWLRLCWLRSEHPDLVRAKEGRTRGLCRMLATRAVANYLACFEGNKGLDHHGTSTIGGVRDCFVTEPYGNLDDARRVFQPLARVLPGVAYAYSGRGAWFRGTVRGILIPPLVMPTSKRRKQP